MNKHVEIQVFHVCGTVSTKFATQKDIFMNGLMLLKIGSTCSSVITRRKGAWKTSVSIGAEFSDAVKLSDVHFQIRLRVANVFAVLLLAFELAVIVDGNHVLEEAVFLYFCLEFAISALASAIDVVVFLHFPVKAVSMFVEKVQVAFWETNCFCQLLEFFGYFFFLL